MKKPSKERGCEGKMNLGSSYAQQADKMSEKHGKAFGVYRCPHCQGTHLTTKLEKRDDYEPLLYIAGLEARNDSTSHQSACSVVPVIVDPDYSRFVVMARLASKEHGYALAVHGSLVRDLDLIAVPWAESCSTPQELVEKIEYRTECKTNGHPVAIREHGRLSLVFMIAGNFGDPRYVDFSIIPPKDNEQI